MPWPLFAKVISALTYVHVFRRLSLTEATPMTILKMPVLQTIDAYTLQQELESDRVLLVDVRERSEYRGEHIPNAYSLPLSSFKPEQLPKGDRSLVLYCQTGNRSAEAGKRLLANQWSEVIHLDGGLQAWKAAGQATVVNPNAPISIMRQVQIIAGTLILTGTLLGAFVSPAFLLLSGLVGTGLTFAGVSGTCMMATLLGKLPYNR
jgi:rhodanese-related sulfurtransferase